MLNIYPYSLFRIKKKQKCVTWSTLFVLFFEHIFPIRRRGSCKPDATVMPRLEPQTLLEFHIFACFLDPTAPRGGVFDVHHFECLCFSILSKRHTGTLIFYMLISDAFFRLCIPFFLSNFAFICREPVFQTVT